MLAQLLAAAVAGYLLFQLFRNRFTYLKDVPGPERASLVWGDLQRIIREEAGTAHREWLDKYGSVVRYTGFWGQQRLVVEDPVALNHILLSRAYDYPKPNEVRGTLGRIVGKGLLFAEGDDHRRQKRIIQPAFSPGALRELVPVFVEKTLKLKAAWNSLIDAGKSDAKAFANEEQERQFATSSKHSDGEIVVDVAQHFSRVTLDIIGVAGFGYEFDSLEHSDNPLAQAVNMMGRGSGRRPTVRLVLLLRTMSLLMNVLPFLQHLPIQRIKALREGFEVADVETRKVLEAKRREAEEAKAAGEETKGRDLISLLLKSNVGDAKNQMTDVELQGQMTTFALAGHETTATALTWLGWRLAQQPEIQTKLRNEIRQATDKAHAENRELNADDIQSLEYLDACTREILRLEPPVSLTVRTCKVNDVVPLSKPIQSRTKGKMIDSFPMQKDQQILVPIAAINKSKAHFGADAEQFRPERWLDGSVDELSGRGSGKEKGESTTATAGIWSGLMTFIAGPRACIGYRFALLEFKTIVCMLLPAFEFVERPDKPAIERRSNIVTRPVLIGEEDLGPRMPLVIRRVSDI